MYQGKLTLANDKGSRLQLSSIIQLGFMLKKKRLTDGIKKWRNVTNFIYARKCLD